MVLSLHIEVVFTRVGSVNNPQPKVVGVRFKFGPPSDVTFRCLGLGCGNGQTMEVSTSVGFVDITRPALEEFMDFPVLDARYVGR